MKDDDIYKNFKVSDIFEDIEYITIFKDIISDPFPAKIKVNGKIFKFDGLG